MGIEPCLTCNWLRVFYQNKRYNVCTVDDKKVIAGCRECKLLDHIRIKNGKFHLLRFRYSSIP